MPGHYDNFLPGDTVSRDVIYGCKHAFAAGAILHDRAHGTLVRSTGEAACVSGRRETMTYLQVMTSDGWTYMIPAEIGNGYGRNAHYRQPYLEVPLIPALARILFNRRHAARAALQPA